MNMQPHPVTPDDEIVTVTLNDHGLWTCKHGEVGTPDSAMHGRGPNRSCIHTLAEPPGCMLFGRDWVNRLLWQPCLYTDWHPVIASRKDNTVTLAFDRIGPTKGCRNRETRLIGSNRFTYTMFGMRWHDNEKPWNMAWLGVKI